VSPNPLVGAVIVRDGEVIGEGFHAELGGLHAERAALADARQRGADPAGATMYVTLEPCAHQGRQPPCVEAILEAGIAGVVVASEDPTKKASGRGPIALRDAGLEVELAAGAEAAAARLQNQPFRKHGRTGLPLVTLKLAMSLDGRTATAAGDSPWISGERSRELVHRWRGESDAIAVGIGTVLADDPLLTARLGEARQPVRVVFDSDARLPLDSQLLTTLDQSPVLVVTAPDADAARAAALRAAGAETITAPGATPGDRVHAALAELGRRNITSLFLEGGRTLAASFTESDQIDEVKTFVAPVLLGSETDVQGGGSGAQGHTENENLARRYVPVGRFPRNADPLARRNVPGGRRPRPASHGPLSVNSQQVDQDTLITARFKEW
jgi:diaminohydroxyphosphoribosylaminopyrimidine deaminase/5-amino-6-(5-phosphoribosylamino)uracil reductase